MSATISIILDTRRTKKNNKYPLKLRVTFERVSEYYQTVFELSEDGYEKLSAPRISNDLQTIRDKLKDLEHLAENAAREIRPFSFDDFEKDFIQHNHNFRRRKSKPELASPVISEFDYSSCYKKFPILLKEDPKPGTISIFYKNIIKKMLTGGRIGTAMYYHCSYVSLKKFKRKCSPPGHNCFFFERV